MMCTIGVQFDSSCISGAGEEDRARWTLQRLTPEADAALTRA